ncbi:MAG: hypothetical protein R3C39_15245 [Dehalococcoidia bacterium]
MRWDFFRRGEPEDPAARTGSAARDERLSAYLDGDLAAEEQRVVETDLERDAGLRTMLEGMALVRDGMHELGMMQSPRSFTITASRRPRSSGLPRLELGMRIATAAASVALVAAFIGPTFLGSSSSDEAATGQPVTVESRAAKEGEAAGAAAAQSGTVESLAASAPAPNDGAAQPGVGAAGGVGGGLETAPQSPEAPPAASPENASGPAGGADAGSAAASGAAELAAPTEEGTAAADSGTPPTAPTTPVAEARSAAPATADASAAATAAGEVEQATALSSTDDEPSMVDSSDGVDWVEWTRIGAAAALVALGLGTLGLWWRRRSYGRYGM